MDAGTDRHPRPVRIGVAGLPQQVLRRRDGPGDEALTGQQREEERDQLVADELVDESVVPKTTLVAVAKYRSRSAWNSPGDIASARDVDPRMSANSIAP